MEVHKKKDGHRQAKVCLVDSVTDQDITQAVRCAREAAQQIVADLGMAELLQEHKSWANPPMPTVKDGNTSEEEEEDLSNEELAGDECIPELLLEANSSQDSDSVALGIEQLASAGLTKEDMAKHLRALHRSSFRKVASNTIPVFDLKSEPFKSEVKCKFCPYVEVERNGKTLFIDKTTAVWLLQEGERLSSDSLFRVRSKQPYSNDVQRTLEHIPHLLHLNHFCLCMRRLKWGASVYSRQQKVGGRLEKSYSSVIISRKPKVLVSTSEKVLMLLTSQRVWVFFVHGTLVVSI